MMTGGAQGEQHPHLAVVHLTLSQPHSLKTRALRAVVVVSLLAIRQHEVILLGSASLHVAGFANSHLCPMLLEGTRRQPQLHSYARQLDARVTAT